MRRSVTPRMHPEFSLRLVEQDDYIFPCSLLAFFAQFVFSAPLRLSHFFSAAENASVVSASDLLFESFATLAGLSFGAACGSDCVALAAVVPDELSLAAAFGSDCVPLSAVMPEGFSFEVACGSDCPGLSAVMPEALSLGSDCVDEVAAFFSG